MSTVLAVKPIRVITELTPTEQFRRAVERAISLSDAGHARVDAEFAQRVVEAQRRYLPTAEKAAPTSEPAAVNE